MGCYDLTGDGQVDSTDIAVISARVGAIDGEAGYDARLDLDDNGVIDGADVNIVIAELGKECP